MSWMRYMTLASFRYYNPDWEMRLYTPTTACIKRTWKSRELDDQEYNGQDHSARLGNLNIEMHEWQSPVPSIPPAHACDLCQWELLSTVGGFYSDMDILYVQPIERVFKICSLVDVVLCKAGPDLAIGFLASCPRCPLFSSIYNEALRSIKPDVYQCAGTEAMYRAARMWPVQLLQDPDTSSRAITKLRVLYPSLSILELPGTTVYPRIWNVAAEFYKSTEQLPTETIGIHWYGGLELSQKYNRLWTEKNFRLYHCTFTKYAEQVPCG
jgi:hypothetical protein